MGEAAPPTPRWFREAIETPFREHRIEVADCPIHYLEWGERDRPGVVLVHGGAAHAHWWAFLAPLLTHHYRVLAIDLSGHGDSGRRDAYPREVWADEVMAAADHANFVGPPVLVGHSMGGFVCIAAASRFGEKLAGAIIVDSPVRRPDPEAEEGAHGRSFRNPKLYPSVEAALERFRLVPPQPCENPYILDYIARHSLHRVEGGFTWKFDPVIFRRVTPRAAHEILPKVACRVALLRAEFGLVTPDIGDYMYELLDRNAPVIEIPQAHHHLMLDQPLAFVTALRALLADWEHSVPRARYAGRTRRAGPSAAPGGSR
jgi:pimeloyl-ACP methyl ester carboxylesterase